MGYHIDYGNVKYEPFGNLAIVRQAGESFVENGNLATLQVNSASMNTSFSTLGVRAVSTFKVDGTNWTSQDTLGWRHAFGDTLPTSEMTLSGSSPFNVTGLPVTINAAILELALAAPVARNGTLSVAYTGLVGSGMRNNALRANFGWKF
ncbi:outer membrane autotransporter protein [Herbaspirillum sp. Sphag1AN]|nr:outer membrane autotransporter protein [Herbaspirillum sp. Sphag1AN]MBB3244131.1 outer membrane autotransporter protein [Herbaspirillum sp. Sphag64]